jgi:uncharacterized protein (DUF433 family)
MNWKEFIHSDPEILKGKPVITGTRLSVEFILGLYEKGWTEEIILENYPSLTHESLKALFAYVKECMELETVFDIK